MMGGGRPGGGQQREINPPTVVEPHDGWGGGQQREINPPTVVEPHEGGGDNREK